MTDWTAKTYWIVGASEGLGRALAHQMSRAGVQLVVSARSEDRLRELVEELPGRARAVTVDVTDMASVRAAAREAGVIDGMIYMAGAYWPMKATEWDNDKVATMGDTNYLGAARVAGEVVGPMLERGRGHIVLTGSLSGFRGVPGAIGYAPSKAGVMHLAESMQADLRGSGVRVQLANPGFIRTRLTDKNDFKMPFIMEPEEAARIVFEHMGSSAFSRNFPWHFSLLFRLSRFLPDALYFRLFGGASQ